MFSIFKSQYLTVKALYKKVSNPEMKDNHFWNQIYICYCGLFILRINSIVIFSSKYHYMGIVKLTLPQIATFFLSVMSVLNIFFFHRMHIKPDRLIMELIHDLMVFNRRQNQSKHDMVEIIDFTTHIDKKSWLIRLIRKIGNKCSKLITELNELVVIDDKKRLKHFPNLSIQIRNQISGQLILTDILIGLLTILYFVISTIILYYLGIQMQQLNCSRLIIILMLIETASTLYQVKLGINNFLLFYRILTLLNIVSCRHMFYLNQSLSRVRDRVNQTTPSLYHQAILSYNLYFILHEYYCLLRYMKRYIDQYASPMLTLIVFIIIILNIENHLKWNEKSFSSIVIFYTIQFISFGLIIQPFLHTNGVLQQTRDNFYYPQFLLQCQFTKTKLKLENFYQIIDLSRNHHWFLCRLGTFCVTKLFILLVRILHKNKWKNYSNFFMIIVHYILLKHNYSYLENIFLLT